MYNVIDRRLSHAALIVQGYGCPHLSVQFESFFFGGGGMKDLYNDVICHRFLFLERNLFVECGKIARNNVYRGSLGHWGLWDETPTNKACVRRSRLHTPCIDRPPPPRSLEINSCLSAIAHWKDVCIGDPSVIDSRSPSRHITPHTYKASKTTLGNTSIVLANTSLYRGHLSNLFWYPSRVPAGHRINAVAPSFPHYEGVMVAHRQPTFRCTQIHLKGTFERY